MPEYRVYTLDASGHIDSVDVINAVDDAGAKALVRNQACLQHQEIWCGARKVALVSATTSDGDRSWPSGADQRQSHPGP